MPTITAQGKTIQCRAGENLRQVLLNHNIDLYNGKAKFINCLGIGSCGTCAVEINGFTAPPNWRDRTRRSLPPHDPARNLRLACQVTVTEDITVTKYDQFWGQGNNIVW
ncbi:MAG: (2Fe-2S)-binding protein [Thermosynechococcaceae cyanobacterium MS004]|nr:(2Fe-2S)-binding protein [Thermosynechococcaceae cyanobacterium MS004]